MNYENIPPKVMAGMKRYVEHGIKPGSFLTAVIQNNLCEALRRADNDSFKAIKDIVGWFFNEVPSLCWGSEEKMMAWIKMKEEKE